jgi:glyoxylase-like metal-dependent hydrolase (beta-lactamase superfamily II)
MKVWTTGGGTRVSRLLDGRCNCFLVSDGRASLLVDSGLARSWKVLSRRLDERTADEGALALLVLTHAHFDHAGNAARLRERGVPVAIHREEAGNLRRGDGTLPRGTNWLTRRIVEPLGRLLQSRLRYAPSESQLVVEGERHDLRPLGFDAYLLHLPGHSPGSLAVIVGEEIALVGDAVFGLGPVFPPFADDPALLVSSWKRLLDTGCRLFLPAHGLPVSRERLQRGYDRRVGSQRR